MCFSDGIFDNLHDHELETIVRDAINYIPMDGSTLMIDTAQTVKAPKTSPRTLATKICNVPSFEL